MLLWILLLIYLISIGGTLYLASHDKNMKSNDWPEMIFHSIVPVWNTFLLICFCCFSIQDYRKTEPSKTTYLIRKDI